MADGTNVTVYNAVELGLLAHAGGTPSRFLLTGGIYDGIIIGTDGGSPAKPAVLVNAPHPYTRFEVYLTAPSGFAGDASNPASFTYTVLSSIAGVTLGTSMSPTWAREVGLVNPAVHGSCWYDGGGHLILAQVDEVPIVAACPAGGASSAAGLSASSWMGI
jgi:hypothetical protein